MQKVLTREKKLIRLRRNEKLQPECMYILSSEAVSTNLYFESKKDIVFAHKLIDRHLSPILDVVSYLFTATGWVLVVSIKDEASLKLYLSKKSGTKKRALLDIPYQISQHLRYMISGLVKAINRRTGRKGTLVSRVFGRYICYNVEDALEIIDRLEHAEYRINRHKRRYWASMGYWDEGGDFQSRTVDYLSSLGRIRGGGMGLMSIGLLALGHFTKDVLHHLIDKALLKHLNQIPTKNPTKTKRKINKLTSF